MIDASGRSALGVLASCIVHAAVVLGVHRHGRASQRTPVQPLWLELRVEQREPSSAPEPPAPHEEPTPARHSPRRERSAVQPARDAPEPAVVPTVDSADAESSKQAAPSGRQAATLDLSPLAAARTLGDSTYFPLRDAGAANHDDPPRSPMAQADSLARQVPYLRASRGSGRSVEGAVVDAVEDTLYNVLRPWQLLRKTMRGSQYRYTGAGFDAAILPDGRVRFRDKDGPSLTMTVVQSREFGPSAQMPPAVTGGVGLGDPRALWYRIRGKDPFAAERLLFLERTRALREHLAGRAAERGAPTVDESSAGEEALEPQLEPPAN
jgi:hypothetical protein